MIIKTMLKCSNVKSYYSRMYMQLFLLEIVAIGYFTPKVGGTNADDNIKIPLFQRHKTYVGLLC